MRFSKNDLPMLEILSGRPMHLDQSKLDVQRRADRFVQAGWALLTDRTLTLTKRGFQTLQAAKMRQAQKLLKRVRRQS